MKKLFKVLFFSIFLLLIQSKTIFAVGNEQINSFHSDIVINQDTSIDITETIDYTTTLQKHGIYRYIPISYNHNGEKRVLPISNIRVTDDKGKPIQYEKSSDGLNLNLKIGDPDRTFSGRQTYVISYSVERAVNSLEENNQLLWDITGEGWQIPISKSSAKVTSDFATVQNAECFSGFFGTSDGLCESNFVENYAEFIYEKPINYGDNLTVLLILPKESQLIFPTQNELLLLWFRYNWPIFLLPLPLLIMFIWWFKKGRDIQFISPNVFDFDATQPTQFRPLQLKAREPMVYAPLKDLTPGEAGALIDEKVNVQDIVAEILELARKKFLKITVEDKKQLFGKKREYVFKKLKQSSAGLSVTQEYLFTQLFKTGESVTLSSLKGTFYTVINEAKTKLETELMNKKVYSNKPTNVRVSGILIYILLSAGLIFSIATVMLPLGIFWPLIVAIIQVPLGLIIAYNLPQKTAVGTNLWLQARGLRKTIKTGKWRAEINEKNLFIEEILPFAVALGVVKQLSKDMKELQLEPPQYLNTNSLVALNTTNFVSSFSNDVANSLSYNPSSSSSGGGGFSGGGGGGGGGGSW